MHGAIREAFDRARIADVHALDGKLPINPTGGLIGLGHPAGATGVRMLLDGYKQVSGQAGDDQVEGARARRRARHRRQ